MTASTQANDKSAPPPFRGDFIKKVYGKIPDGYGAKRRLGLIIGVKGE